MGVLSLKLSQIAKCINTRVDHRWTATVSVLQAVEANWIAENVTGNMKPGCNGVSQRMGLGVCHKMGM